MLLAKAVDHNIPAILAPESDEGAWHLVDDSDYLQIWVLVLKPGHLPEVELSETMEVVLLHLFARLVPPAMEGVVDLHDTDIIFDCEPPALEVADGAPNRRGAPHKHHREG